MTKIYHPVLKSITGLMDSLYTMKDQGNKWKTKITVTELQYVDNNGTVAYTKSDFQLAVEAVDYAYSNLRIKMNIKRTQVLHQPKLGLQANQVRPPTITVKREPLNNVENLSCLGSCLSTKADVDRDIAQKIQATSAAFGRLRARVLNNKDCYFRTKLKVY